MYNAPDLIASLKESLTARMLPEEHTTFCFTANKDQSPLLHDVIGRVGDKDDIPLVDKTGSDTVSLIPISCKTAFLTLIVGFNKK